MSIHPRRVLLHAAILTAVIVAPVVFDCGPRVTAQVPAASESPRYALPPKTIVDAFDAEPLPQTILSPNKQVVALIKARTYPTIAELAQPMYRLAGSRDQSEDQRSAPRLGPAGHRHLLDHAEEDCRRRRDHGESAAAGAHLARQVLARRLASRLPADEGRCDRAVGRGRHDRRRQGGRQRSGSHQRHGRRSLRLAEGQRDDGLRAGAGRPRCCAGRAAGARRVRTSRRTTARRRPRRPTKIC